MPRLLYTQLMCLMAVIASLLSTAQAGPFDGLNVIEGVETSRNGRWISIGVWSGQYRARVPGFEETVTPAMGPDQGRMFLSVDCRAGPATEHFPARPAQAELAIPDHPDQIPHNWWNPMYWILELTGNHVEKVPVRLTFADVHEPGPVWHSERNTLERYRTDYSAVRKLLSVWIDGPTVLEILAKRRDMQVQVRGQVTQITAVFKAAPQLREAAQKMLRHCPKENPARR
ncbi:MAG: hypothetical protein F4Y00_00860 [Bacteroidetes bacterium SB0662_bin_6]|nr:hypothetical protein [Gammaproteobacteria bacterium]MYE03517.1 hypothetical protein [Bacteroidetes bacterium SB0662_bin_6]